MPSLRPFGDRYNYNQVWLYTPMDSSNVNERFGVNGGRVRPCRQILSVYSLEQHASFQAFEAVWFRCSFSQDTALRELSSDIWPLKMTSLRGHDTLGNRQSPSDGAHCHRRTETSAFSMYWLHTDLARPSWIKQRFFTMKVTPYWAVLIFDFYIGF